MTTYWYIPKEIKNNTNEVDFKKIIKAPNFGSLSFKAPVYYAGAYIDTVDVKIKREFKKNKPTRNVITVINFESQRGFRVAYKALKNENIRDIRLCMLEEQKKFLNRNQKRS